MVSYIGAHGARLQHEQPRNISHLNPHFGDVSFFPGGITSNYQSLQSKFQRSISHGAQALASYTHCKATQISDAAAWANRPPAEDLRCVVPALGEPCISHALTSLVNGGSRTEGQPPMLPPIMPAWNQIAV